jgi:hypothetical protein
MKSVFIIAINYKYTSQQKIKRSLLTRLHHHKPQPHKPHHRTLLHHQHFHDYVVKKKREILRNFILKFG